MRCVRRKGLLRKALCDLSGQRDVLLAGSRDGWLVMIVVACVAAADAGSGVSLAREKARVDAVPALRDCVLVMSVTARCLIRGRWWLVVQP